MTKREAIEQAVRELRHRNWKHFAHGSKNSTRCGLTPKLNGTRDGKLDQLAQSALKEFGNRRAREISGVRNWLVFRRQSAIAAVLDRLAS